MLFDIKNTEELINLFLNRGFSIDDKEITAMFLEEYIINSNNNILIKLKLEYE